MTLLTRIVVGGAAFLAATTLVASAAMAEVTQYSKVGHYTVMKATDGSMCGMALTNSSGATLIVAHSSDHETGISYHDSQLGDLTGKSYNVTFVIDKAEYDWTAEGGEDSRTIISKDTSLPTALANATFFGELVGETPIFAIKSDAEFEQALNATLKCAHGK